MPLQQLINIIIKRNNTPITIFIFSASVILNRSIRQRNEPHRRPSLDLKDSSRMYFTAGRKLTLKQMKRKLWAGQTGVPIPARTRDLPLLQNVKKGFGAHPTSHLMGSGIIYGG